MMGSTHNLAHFAGDCVATSCFGCLNSLGNVNVCSVKNPQTALSLQSYSSLVVMLVVSHFRSLLGREARLVYHVLLQKPKVQK